MAFGKSVFSRGVFLSALFLWGGLAGESWSQFSGLDSAQDTAVKAHCGFTTIDSDAAVSFDYGAARKVKSSGSSAFATATATASGNDDDVGDNGGVKATLASTAAGTKACALGGGADGTAIVKYGYDHPSDSVIFAEVLKGSVTSPATARAVLANGRISWHKVEGDPDNPATTPPTSDKLTRVMTIVEAKIDRSVTAGANMAEALYTGATGAWAPSLYTAPSDNTGATPADGYTDRPVISFNRLFDTADNPDNELPGSISGIVAFNEGSGGAMAQITDGVFEFGCTGPKTAARKNIRGGGSQGPCGPYHGTMLTARADNGSADLVIKNSHLEWNRSGYVDDGQTTPAQEIHKGITSVFYKRDSSGNLPTPNETTYPPSGYEQVMPEAAIAAWTASSSSSATNVSSNITLKIDEGLTSGGSVIMFGPNRHEDAAVAQTGDDFKAYSPSATGADRNNGFYSGILLRAGENESGATASANVTVDVGSAASATTARTHIHSRSESSVFLIENNSGKTPSAISFTMRNTSLLSLGRTGGALRLNESEALRRALRVPSGVSSTFNINTRYFHFWTGAQNTCNFAVPGIRDTASPAHRCASVATNNPARALPYLTGEKRIFEGSDSPFFALGEAWHHVPGDSSTFADDIVYQTGASSGIPVDIDASRTGGTAGSPNTSTITVSVDLGAGSRIEAGFKTAGASPVRASAVDISGMPNSAAIIIGSTTYEAPGNTRIVGDIVIDAAGSNSVTIHSGLHETDSTMDSPSFIGDIDLKGGAGLSLGTSSVPAEVEGGNSLTLTQYGYMRGSYKTPGEIAKGGINASACSTPGATGCVKVVDTVRIDGKLEGGLDLKEGDDTLKGSGVVTGMVQMGTGANVIGDFAATPVAADNALDIGSALFVSDDATESNKMHVGAVSGALIMLTAPTLDGNCVAEGDQGACADASFSIWGSAAGSEEFIVDGDVAGHVNLGGGTGNTLKVMGEVKGDILSATGAISATGATTLATASGSGLTSEVHISGGAGSVSLGDGDNTLVILAPQDGAAAQAWSGVYTPAATGKDTITVKSGASMSNAAAMDLGGGDDSVTVEATGVFAPPVSFSAGADSLMGAGTVMGDVSLGAGNDRIGSADGAQGMDSLVIEGGVDLGAGEDNVKAARIGGNLTGSDDKETVELSAIESYAGNIDLKGGENTLSLAAAAAAEWTGNYGTCSTVGNDVTCAGSAAIDTMTIGANVTTFGIMAFGGGNNILDGGATPGYGEVGGMIEMGAGNDRIGADPAAIAGADGELGTADDGSVDIANLLTLSGDVILGDGENSIWAKTGAEETSAITGGAGPDTVILTGSIGDVDLGGGDNVLVAQSAGSITALDGDDRVVLSGMATGVVDLGEGNNEIFAPGLQGIVGSGGDDTVALTDFGGGAVDFDLKGGTNTLTLAAASAASTVIWSGNYGTCSTGAGGAVTCAGSDEVDTVTIGANVSSTGVMAFGAENDILDGGSSGYGEVGGMIDMGEGNDWIGADPSAIAGPDGMHGTSDDLSVDSTDLLTLSGEVILGAGENRIWAKSSASGSISAGDENDTVLLSGDVGDVNLGGGDNVLRAGSTGAITALGGVDRIVLTGSAGGAVELGAGGELDDGEVDGENEFSAVNAGRIAGGDGKDTIRLTGDASGDIILGDGENVLSAVDAAGISGGADKDMITLTGSASGDIILGDGENVLSAVDAAGISGGADKDTFTLTGSASGDVILGGGENELSAMSARSVTGGSGPDTVTLSAYAGGAGDIDLGVGDGANSLDIAASAAVTWSGNYGTCSGSGGAVTCAGADAIDTVTIGSNITTVGIMAFGAGNDILDGGPAGYGTVGGMIDMGEGNDWIGADPIAIAGPDGIHGTDDDLGVDNSDLLTLSGDVILGAGENRIWAKSSASGSISAGDEDDTVLLSGDAGDVNLGGGENVLRAGSTGAITVLGESDRIVLTGSASGLVALGGGDNTFKAVGAAGISAGAGKDIIKLSGSASGLVALGGGDNEFEAVDAAGISAGAGKDIIKLSGSASGDVLMGAGGNELSARSAGNITGGRNSDEVTLTAFGGGAGNIDLGDGANTLTITPEGAAWSGSYGLGCASGLGCLGRGGEGSDTISILPGGPIAISGDLYFGDGDNALRGHEGVEITGNVVMGERNDQIGPDPSAIAGADGELGTADDGSVDNPNLLRLSSEVILGGGDNKLWARAEAGPDQEPELRRVTGGAGKDTVLVAGPVGDAHLGGGDNVLIALRANSITGGSGKDTVILDGGDGSAAGLIDLGSGNNTIMVHSAGAIAVGSGVDMITLKGSVGGDVDLGGAPKDLQNTLEVGGTIAGDVTSLGDGNDVVSFVGGSGSVNLGSGENTLTMRDGSEWDGSYGSAEDGNGAGPDTLALEGIYTTKDARASWRLGGGSNTITGSWEVLAEIHMGDGDDTIGAKPIECPPEDANVPQPPGCEDPRDINDPEHFIVDGATFDSNSECSGVECNRFTAGGALNLGGGSNYVKILAAHGITGGSNAADTVNSRNRVAVAGNSDGAVVFEGLAGNTLIIWGTVSRSEEGGPALVTGGGSDIVEIGGALGDIDLGAGENMLRVSRPLLEVDDDGNITIKDSYKDAHQARRTGMVDGAIAGGSGSDEIHVDGRVSGRISLDGLDSTSQGCENPQNTNLPCVSNSLTVGGSIGEGVSSGPSNDVVTVNGAAGGDGRSSGDIDLGAGSNELSITGFWTGRYGSCGVRTGGRCSNGGGNDTVTLLASPDAPSPASAFTLQGMHLGDGENSVSGAGTLGDVEAGSGADTIGKRMTNDDGQKVPNWNESRFILGDVDLGDGDNTITAINSGAISGGDGIDDVYLSGNVTGNIDLKGGARNMLDVRGSIVGKNYSRSRISSVAEGEGPDRDMVSVGTLVGHVSLGGGENELSVTTLMSGNYSGGEGDDRIMLKPGSSAVMGSLSLGGGVNSVYVAGSPGSLPAQSVLPLTDPVDSATNNLYVCNASDDFSPAGPCMNPGQERVDRAFNVEINTHGAADSSGWDTVKITNVNSSVQSVLKITGKVVLESPLLENAMVASNGRAGDEITLRGEYGVTPETVFDLDVDLGGPLAGLVLPSDRIVLEDRSSKLPGDRYVDDFEVRMSAIGSLGESQPGRVRIDYAEVMHGLGAEDIPEIKVSGLNSYSEVLLGGEIWSYESKPSGDSESTVYSLVWIGAPEIPGPVEAVGRHVSSIVEAFDSQSVAFWTDRHSLPGVAQNQRPVAGSPVWTYARTVNRSERLTTNFDGESFEMSMSSWSVHSGTELMAVEASSGALVTYSARVNVGGAKSRYPNGQVDTTNFGLGLQSEHLQPNGFFVTVSGQAGTHKGVMADKTPGSGTPQVTTSFSFNSFDASAELGVNLRRSPSLTLIPSFRLTYGRLNGSGNTFNYKTRTGQSRSGVMESMNRALGDFGLQVNYDSLWGGSPESPESISRVYGKVNFAKELSYNMRFNQDGIVSNAELDREWLNTAAGVSWGTFSNSVRVFGEISIGRSTGTNSSGREVGLAAGYKAEW